MARPRKFDEQVLLERAQDEFWVNGYDRTSIDDIATATGVGNGSLYSAYGSKLGLFLAVFQRYCDGRVALVDGVVSMHSGSFESAVANYLDEIVADCTSGLDRRGCLMLNSLAELGGRFPEVADIGRRSVGAMQRIVSDRVRRAVAAGELDLTSAEADALGAHIVLVSQGLIQLSRIGTPLAELQSIAATSTKMSALMRTA
ncbi:MAG: TetR/AcrR family transcriptional regulator [Glaciihabitans sp.]|nr:TetR/AcrR family transcriptional regulator [Glaciihabitans sp.]